MFYDTSLESIRQTVHELQRHFLFGEGHFLLQRGRGLINYSSSLLAGKRPKLRVHGHSQKKKLLCPYLEIYDVINPRPKMRMLGYPLMPIYGDPQASNQGPNSPRPCLALLTYVLCPYMEIPILSISRTLLWITYVRSQVTLRCLTSNAVCNHCDLNENVC